MNKDTLIQLFKAPYKRQSFIDNALLPTFQGKVANLTIYDQQGVQEIDLTASEQNYAVSAVKYGEFQTLDEIPRTVELFEIIVNDNKQIERSRVGLGALVKKHIIGNNAVLVNFAYQNPEKRTWRFSFIARDGVFQDGEMQITDTHPKRYTYVFGEKEETYKTALDRFFILGNELEITINKIKDAFGVEAMSKAFFDEYRDVHYAGFVDYLMRSNFKKSAFNGNDKDVRDFVKKLLGRIVFLYFLQKKGWLGAKDTSYKNGDKNFMTNFFKKAGANDAFYANWLSKLFFDALNNERPNDDFTMPDGEVVKIPYLNGGLFEKETEKYDFLTFPADLFTNLFEFFDQYNFTIFEDSPEEHTVAVDPEMLGHIFENLLEDNKDKGAFYTPKEIVHYMTQESLIEYLHTQLPDANRTELENFVKNKENNLSKEHKQQIDQKLDTVKICDPAIGSGAFPMGLLQEIFGLKERIAYDLGYKVWSPATVKENIIQKSIYGVDIERGAVDIARLRFWLSLIVDEEMPKALPNLDYKIVVGNSLVSKFDDTVIEIDWSDDTAKEGLFGQEIAEDKKKLLKEISIKQSKYFTADNALKEKLNLEIRNLKLDILTKQLELMIENKGFKGDSMQGLNKKQIETWQQTQDWKKALSDIRTLKDNPNKSFNHFDWKLDFPEVLNPLVNENTGFDIVIGNPPWVSMKGKHGLEESKRNDFNLLQQMYNASTYRPNLFEYFVIMGLKLQIKSGVFCYIIPDRLGYNSSLEYLRNDILEHYTIKKIVYKWKFEGIIADTMTLLVKNERQVGDYILKIKNRPEQNYLNYFKSDLKLYNKLIFKSYQNEIIKNAIKTILLKGVKLCPNICVSATGFIGVSNLLETCRSNKNQVEVLKGSSIERYRLKEKYYYNLIDENIKGGTKDRNKLSKKEKILIRKTGNSIMSTYVSNSEIPEQSLYFLFDFKISALSVLAIINSKLINWLYITQLITNEDSTPQLKNYDLESIPIVKPSNEKNFEILALAILLLNKNSTDLTNFSIPKSHISEAFEEVIDALVFELYFPEEFAEKGIAIEKYAKDIFKPIDGLSEEDQIKAIQEAYQTLREKDNPLRNQIKLMKIELKELLLPILSV